MEATEASDTDDGSGDAADDGCPDAGTGYGGGHGQADKAAMRRLLMVMRELLPVGLCGFDLLWLVN